MRCLTYKKVLKIHIKYYIYICLKFLLINALLYEYPYIIFYIYAYKFSMGQSDDSHDGGISKVQEQECL